MAVHEPTVLPFDLAGEADAPAPSPNPRQDVEETMRLLKWARENGWEIPVLQVGSVQLRVRDLKPKYRGGEQKQAGEPQTQTSIWDEFRPPGADDQGGKR